MELPNRAQHEADFARRLSRLSSRHRQELVRLLGNPPDPARVPDSFWAKVQREQEEELLLMLLLIFMASGEFHGLDAADARTLGGEWASGRAGSVSADYVVTSRDRLTTIAGEWKGRQETVARDRGFPQGAPSVPLPAVEIEGDVLDVFGPERDSKIATTETTQAQTAGSETATAENGTQSPDDQWTTHPEQTKSGPCPVCAPLNGTPRSYWERFFPGGPPVHPHCACTIQYMALVGGELVGAQ